MFPSGKSTEISFDLIYSTLSPISSFHFVISAFSMLRDFYLKFKVFFQLAFSETLMPLNCDRFQFLSSIRFFIYIKQQTTTNNISAAK